LNASCQATRNYEVPVTVRAIVAAAETKPVEYDSFGA
jgi:hypothetical protein